MKKDVSLVKCLDYEYSKVRASLDQTIGNLGGLEKYIAPGEKVLLKANLLMKKRPEEATTTHPVFIKALADILVEYGCQVVVGDSPGGPFSEAALKGVYKACGYEDIFKNTNVMLNYDISEIDVYNEKCKINKSLRVIGLLNDVDKVISVSKLKTHGMMKFTGAVKNMFGTIPGLVKAEYHFKMPKTQDFSQMLVDVCINADPVLSFMDGIVGMEGNGPSAGNPVEIGAVIGSNSPYHLDVVACSIVGILPESVPTVKTSYDMGLVEYDFSDINLTGDDISEFEVLGFEVPNIKSVEMMEGKAPKFIRGFLNRYLTPKPVFDESMCVGCQECARACPPKAITMKNHYPVVNLDECIRCYCCQELCPKKAVDIHRPWLLSKMVKL